ncbi:VWA domain-containing protein [Nocardioides sp.]|uniref:VWA domain-containing protein n=1 Tax=Nocardioides sp. TaxID=35761 RepID=UPI0027239178|nr:VWA domain-containing protein [Nocardioides sp.]MDO9454795.1 VWA domain-containing protein [Nocardioides sp.]
MSAPVTPMLALASPSWLWLLVPVAALLVLYLLAQRRRTTYAVRFATLPMLERLVPKRPAWRRHVPAVLLLLAFVVLAFAAARPQVDEQVPRERATVIVTVDVSLSMQATDVSPDRLTAAREAAQAFVEGLPDGFNVGIVEFAGSAAVLSEPSPDKAKAIAALDRLELAEGTAIGDGVVTSLAQIEALGDQSTTEDGGEAEPVPAQIVLLSDGTNTVGSSIEQAAAAATEAGVPVSTIAYGTPTGTVEVDGETVPVPVDQPSLDSLADATGGNGYSAETAAELDEVYDDIQSSIGYRTEPRDVTPVVVAAALLLGLLAAGLSLRWFSRLP